MWAKSSSPASLSFQLPAQYPYSVDHGLQQQDWERGNSYYPLKFYLSDGKFSRFVDVPLLGFGSNLDGFQILIIAQRPGVPSGGGREEELVLCGTPEPRVRSKISVPRDSSAEKGVSKSEQSELSTVSVEIQQ